MPARTPHPMAEAQRRKPCRRITERRTKERTPATAQRPYRVFSSPRTPLISRKPQISPRQSPPGTLCRSETNRWFGKAGGTTERLGATLTIRGPAPNARI